MNTATPLEAPLEALIDEPFDDITDVWNRCHAHLRPLEGAVPPDETQRRPRLTARLRFGKSHWIESATVTYSRDHQRYLLLRSDRAAALKERADLLQTPVEAVDARLWSRAPTMINIEPTTRCNFNCWYCVGRHMQQADIRVENFEKMLDNFPTLRTIALVGEGEPLLHKGFFAMAATARARGMNVLAISNGSAFSQSVIRQLCEVGVTYISISIDSHDPATFAASRIDGDLEKVLAGIKRLRDYRDANGFTFPKIGLKGTLFNDTKNQLPAIVDLAKAAGVEVFESFQALNPMKNYIRIYPQAQQKELTTVDTVSQAIAHDSAYGREALQPIDAFCAEHGIELFPPVIGNPLRKNCNETWLYSLLSGDITPCCQIKTPISPKWNIFTHGVDDILSDFDYENTRFNLWNGFFPDYCTGCWKTR